MFKNILAYIRPEAAIKNLNEQNADLLARRREFRVVIPADPDDHADVSEDARR